MKADADALFELFGQQPAGGVADFGQGDFRLRDRQTQAQDKADEATQHGRAQGQGERYRLRQYALAGVTPLHSRHD